jgi:hypothetical protein
LRGEERGGGGERRESVNLEQVDVGGERPRRVAVPARAESAVSHVPRTSAEGGLGL